MRCVLNGIYLYSGVASFSVKNLSQSEHIVFVWFHFDGLNTSGGLTMFCSTRIRAGKLSETEDTSSMHSTKYCIFSHKKLSTVFQQLITGSSLLHDEQASKML
jgi:hypothetical protein